MSFISLGVVYIRKVESADATKGPRTIHAEGACYAPYFDEYKNGHFIEVEFTGYCPEIVKVGDFVSVSGTCIIEPPADSEEPCKVVFRRTQRIHRWADDLSSESVPGDMVILGVAELEFKIDKCSCTKVRVRHYEV